MTPEGKRCGLMVSQRRRLSLWLAEWRVHKALAAVLPDRIVPATDGDAAASAVVKERMGDGDKNRSLSVGQVRLLRPFGMSLSQIRPVYVVVLRREGMAAWLIAPFSRFANPAVPGEWLTGLRSAPLRVLCLWNARVVDEAAIRSAWFCRKVSRTMIERTLDVWRLARQAKPVGRVSLQRVGPPLLHPLDPRHVYLQEERELLGAHLGFVCEQGGLGVPHLYAIPMSELLKAAEGKGNYGKE